MKVVHVTHNDGNGGASIAAYRLHQGLLARGVDSAFFVKEAYGRHEDVVQYSGHSSAFPLREKLYFKYLSYKYRDFTRTNYSDNPHLLYGIQTIDHTVHQELQEFDIINLHWVSDFIDFPTFFKGLQSHQRVVWTLHDTAAITGGCHYFRHCQRFKESCGSCFQIDSNQENDLSRTIWREKDKFYKGLGKDKLTLVTPSKWLQENALASPLTSRLRVEHIPNGVDPLTYKPMDRKSIRALFDIPEDQVVLLLIQKGESELFRALQKIGKLENVLVLTMGAVPKRLHEIVNMLNLGSISNEQLKVMAYNMADLFILPSVIDNYPNTLLESFACETPALASGVGGIPEIVNDGEHGFLFDFDSIEDFACKLKDAISDRKRLAEIGREARRWVQRNVSLEQQAFLYSELYKELVG